MIYSSKPVLTEDMYVVKRKNFQYHAICAKYTLRPSIFITDNPMFSSERILYKDYYSKGSVGGKISGRESPGASFQDKLTGWPSTASRKVTLTLILTVDSSSDAGRR
jgi:hypothetical protein